MELQTVTPIKLTALYRSLSLVWPIMKLPESWTENCADLLRAFNKEGVEYLLFGSIAESHYRSLASVGDMDVLINPTPENATKVKPALDAL